MPKRKDQDGLYRRPNSPYWWATYTDGRGKRSRRSTGTDNRAKAKVIRAQWELEAEEERQSGPSTPKSKGPIFDEMMLRYLEGPGAEKRSAERDYYSAKQLYPHFSGRELTTLGAMDVREYITQRKAKGVGPGTINRELGLLSSALNWARRDLEWNVPNPAQGRRLKEPEGRVRWLTHDEAETLINATEAVKQAPHLRDLIILGLHTGMRRNEMLGLEWKRVDLQAELVYLEAEHQKSGKVGSVPLNTEARHAILSRSNFRAQHCPSSPWVFCNRNGERIGSVKKSFAAACKAAGIEDFHVHDLRHTCAAWLVQVGVPLPEIRDLLRHSTIKVTERYAHLAPHNVREAVNRLPRHTERVTLTVVDEGRDKMPAATG